MNRVHVFAYLGLLGVLLIAQQAQSTIIDASGTDALKEMPEPRARWTLACGKFRDNEIMYSGGCYLLKPNFIKLLETVPKEILAFDPEKTVDDLLRAFMPRMFVFFEKEYPKFKGALQAFYKLMDGLGKKAATGTKNVNMIDIDEAFEKSGMWAAKKELDDNKAVVEASTANLSLTETNEILAKYRCDSDSLFCPYTNSVFGIVDTNQWNTLFINDFLIKAVNNSIKYLNNPLLGLDYSKIYGLLTDLENLGTAQVKVSRVHILINETRYWPSLINVFLTENYVPPTDPTTTTKTTRTTTERVKVVKKIAVTIEWYLSVPLTIFFVGIVVAAVLFVMTKPKRVESNKKAPEVRMPPPQAPPSHARPEEPRIPQTRQLREQPSYEMKPRTQQTPQEYASDIAEDRKVPLNGRTTPRMKSPRPLQKQEDVTQF